VSLATRYKRRHVLMLGGIAHSLVNFRGPLIRAILAQGHSVTGVAGNFDSDVAATLVSWGAKYEVVPFARSGMNPLADIRSLGALILLMRRIKPDVFLGYTVKPNTFGMMAARIAGIPLRYAMVTGLGYAFIDGREPKRQLARYVAMAAYRIALKRATGVIFQNSDDQAFFRTKLLGRDAATICVGGSGVDLSHFSRADFPEGPITFLMISRLLWDKGVNEFVEAGRIVKKLYPDTRFILVGPLDPSPDTISAEQLGKWVAEGIIDYRGCVTDVRPEISACHVYVLPSYREGTPRTVLEAMAMGRPIITTDTAGCRETINRDRTNGFLVPIRNSQALADAECDMARLPPEAFREMAQASLALVRRRFDVNVVVSQILEFTALGRTRTSNAKGTTDGHPIQPACGEVSSPTE
jgi:glycosyltransferase involved in cell wall biosynthesis